MDTIRPPIEPEHPGVGRREELQVVEIAVEDTGPGIPPDRIDGIFDRYTRSADSGGTGLGLAIAKALVEAHGGSIGAESEEGRGATLRLVLPRDA
jgi:two-component system, OmpR family, sensor kinase